MSGYMGKLLVVDLAKGELQDEPLNPTMAHDFVGGAGYAARYLYDEADRDWIVRNADDLTIVYQEYDWRLNRG